MGLLESLIKNLIITPESVGKRGERLTASKLGWVNLFGYKGKTLQNVYIPRGDGTTTEIDLLYITQKGIFVIESKNYSGYIFGSENQANWTVTLYAGKDWLGRKKVEKHQFYNPVWQNKTHAKFLKQFLGEDVQIISIIVFSERCELKSINITSYDLCVCQRNDIPSVIKRMWGTYPDTLSEGQIDRIYDKLAPLTDQNEAVKQQHVQSIKERFESNDICPRCGGKLVLRTAKQGANAGKQFYGCSNYPSCRYIKNI